jgi:hypothetical protein
MRYAPGCLIAICLLFAVSIAVEYLLFWARGPHQFEWRDILQLVANEFPFVALVGLGIMAIRQRRRLDEQSNQPKNSQD